MICPICDSDYSEVVKYIECESFDDSYLYKDVDIHKCKKCGHLFNILNSKEIQNLREYYKKEHTKNTETTVTRETLNVGINDACSLPFEYNSFELVILDQVLEHLTNPRLAMKEAKRVLKKGGRCLVHVPDAMEYGDEIYWYIMREHVQHFDIGGLVSLARSTGFELIGNYLMKFDMVGTLKLPNLSVVLKPKGKTYCWGIGREFMYLYPNTRLKNLDLVLVDDMKQDRTFKGMKIHSSDILKDADKDSFLIITANVHKEFLEKKALEIGYKGEIIDV